MVLGQDQDTLGGGFQETMINFFSNNIVDHTVKKVAIFLSPAGMSFTKLYQAGSNIIIPGQGEFGK